LSPRKKGQVENPKEKTVRLRMSKTELEKLDYCVDKTGLSISDVLRKGLDEVYKSIKK